MNLRPLLLLVLTLRALPGCSSEPTPSGPDAAVLAGDAGPGLASDAESQPPDATLPGPDASTSDSAVEGPDAGGEAPLEPWLVFRVAGSSTPMKASVLPSGSFEGDAGFSAWRGYQKGFVPAPGEGRSGAGAKLVRTPADATGSGLYQTVSLKQSEPRAIYFSGWMKADAVTGSPDKDFGLYLDIRYVPKSEDPVRGCEQSTSEPCSLWGQTTARPFDVGTHDWQQREGFATPAYPIKEVSFYVLLRGAHAGTAWVDDLTLSEVQADVLGFDGQQVAGVRPSSPVTGGAELPLTTEDGLSLAVWSRGGALASAKLDGDEVLETAYDWASGLFVHEMGTTDYVAPGGVVRRAGSSVEHQGSIAAMSLELRATYSAEADRIRIRAEVADTSGRDRPVTLYWALPAGFAGASWGEDPRRVRPATGAKELTNTTRFWFDPIGATGEFSRYPFTTVFDEGRGLALGYPVDQPRIARLVFQPHTRQLYVALDLGLTAATERSPSRASTELVLYRTRHARAADGFRSALAGFQARHPTHFARRIPVEREGIWNAFDDLSKLQHAAGESIDDFHFGIHEASVQYSDFDDAHGILTFRYLTEPGSTWFRIPDAAGVDPMDYAQVMAWVQGQYANGTAEQKRQAEKTLSSGIFDAAQRYLYEGQTSGPPWCSGKCALFFLSPLPGIAAPPYQLDQALYAWNQAAKDVYVSRPGLDGDYLDSFTMSATRLDFRRGHLRPAEVPPTFAHESPYAVGMPVIFSTVEFARKVKRELLAGKFFIANGGLLGIPFGADLLDFTGQETDWVKEVAGTFTLVPQDDRMLTYYRAMSGQRPYGFLMNTDFAHFTSAMVERYMRVCLFYGIYPSMFSADASSDPYFANPALYNRDRAHFKRYVPLVKELSRAGWQALPGAWTSNPELYLERWGRAPGTTFVTLRNTTDTAITATLTLDRQALGLGSGATRLRARLAGGADLALPAGATRVEVTVGAQDVEMLEVLP